MLGISQNGAMLANTSAACESHRYHSAMLVPAIETLLKETHIDLKELTELAVNLGPGSFTGLRTGLTTVRTMGQFLNLPIHGFNPFELLAFGRQEPTAIYLDALRGRSYHAVLSYQADGPAFQSNPKLISLIADLRSDEHTMPSDASLLISPALAPLFEGRHHETIQAGLQTPLIMLDFINRYGAIRHYHWRKITPLYLQEPSITLKKT